MFLYTEGEESVRLNKNAHCFAVEPSGWRFTFDASIFVTLFRRFAPFDSPRVHQKTTATAVVFVYGGGGVRAFKQKRTLLRSRTLPADATLSMQASSLRYCVTTFLSTPPPPRVHQWRCQATTPQLYLPFGKLDCFAVIFCFANLNFHVVKVKANIISLLANG